MIDALTAAASGEPIATIGFVLTWIGGGIAVITRVVRGRQARKEQIADTISDAQMICLQASSRMIEIQFQIDRVIQRHGVNMSQENNEQFSHFKEATESHLEGMSALLEELDQFNAFNSSHKNLIAAKSLKSRATGGITGGSEMLHLVKESTEYIESAITKDFSS